MILVRVVDSAILSLSLCGIVSNALGVVCLCTPITAQASDIFLDLAEKIFDSRDSFANKSTTFLNTLQKALPFLASVKAYQIAKSNNSSWIDTNYLSIAILMPGQGTLIEPGNINEAKKTLNDVKNQAGDIKQAASEAEEAANSANNNKIIAFNADCGNNPNYCMYERAKNKAFIEGSSNPLYKSVDTWSFSVPLKRCQYYYPKRLEIDKPETNSIEDKANSTLRKIFYSYASKKMQEGYVIDNGDTFSANFPHLPKNTEEMKSTTMYTDTIFPVSNDNCIHVLQDCPGCSNVGGYGSLAQYDAGIFKECDYCKLSSSSLGKVASASTSINNGYEYYYAIVEEASKGYQSAKEQIEPKNKVVKNFADNFFSKIKDTIKDVVNKRIYASPPGSYGTICLTVNTSSSSASKGFENSFVHNGSSLGIRAAVSASTIIEENSDEGKTILNSILDGLSNNISQASGFASIILNGWSTILKVYSQGQKNFIVCVQDALNQIPLASASGLGTWAAKRLNTLMEDIGLEPANLNSLKAVLINTCYVATKEANETNKSINDNFTKNFAVKYLVVKEQAMKISNANNNILQAISGEQQLAETLNLDEIIYKGGSIEIASIQPIGSLGPSIPINIKLPQFQQEQ